MSLWTYADPRNGAANRLNPDGSLDSRLVDDPELAAWIALGNEPAPYAPPEDGDGGLQEF